MKADVRCQMSDVSEEALASLLYWRLTLTSDI
jgi:hypothetical protein